MWEKSSNLVEATVVNNLSIVCFQDPIVHTHKAGFIYFLVELVYKLQDGW